MKSQENSAPRDGDDHRWLSMLDLPKVLRETAREGMPPRAFRLLLAIEAHCRDRWFCWPSNETLAELAGCHANQLWAHLRWLRGKNWITNLQRNDKAHGARYIAMLKRLDPKMPKAPEGATWDTAEAERVTGNHVTQGYGEPRNRVTGNPVTTHTGNHVTTVTGNPATKNHSGESARIPNHQGVESIPPPTPSRGRTSCVDLDIPDWIPPDDWTAYVEARESWGCPFSEVAKSQLIARLDRKRRCGHDPGDMLRTCVVEYCLTPATTRKYREDRRYHY